MARQHPTSFHLSAEAMAAITRLAKKTGLSRASVVELAVRWLDHSADQAVAWSKGWRPPSDGENDGGNGDNRA